MLLLNTESIDRLIENLPTLKQSQVNLCRVFASDVWSALRNILFEVESFLDMFFDALSPSEVDRIVLEYLQNIYININFFWKIYFSNKTP